jgi:hypothetical protein
MHEMHHSVLLAQWYCGGYGALLTLRLLLVNSYRHFRSTIIIWLYLRIISVLVLVRTVISNTNVSFL